MIRQIAPQFFTTDMKATLATTRTSSASECQGTWQDPPQYTIVMRDQHRIHFRFMQSLYGDERSPSPAW